MKLPLLLITTFGLGHCKPASGTWGSLPPAIVGAALAWFGLRESVTWYGSMGLFTLAFSLFCVRYGTMAEHAFGKKDPGKVVADETAGMGLVLLLMPWPGLAWMAKWSDRWHLLALIASAFVLFRAADIVKVWPAGALQRVRGGWGILLDDLVAGVQAAACVWVLAWITPLH